MTEGHICKSMYAYQTGKQYTLEDEGMKSDHFAGKYYVKYDEEFQKSKEKNKNGNGIDLKKKFKRC